MCPHYYHPLFDYDCCVRFTQSAKLTALAFGTLLGALILDRTIANSTSICVLVNRTVISTTVSLNAHVFSDDKTNRWMFPHDSSFVN